MNAQQQWEDMVLRGPEAAKAPAAPARPEAAPQPEINASYLTHELRAPLTSVRSALLLLQEKLDGKLSDDEAQLLLLALKNSDRLGGLISDIMSYSKIRSGKLSMHPQSVYPRLLVQEAIDGMKAWSLSKGVKLLRSPEEEPLPRVSADPQRVHQILTNLISNAIKFTNPGGRIEVTTKIGRHEHAGTIVFSVKDTGCGIDPEERDTIFQAFEQSSKGGPKMSQGTGLGLTLAKAMVELQGGRIWVESWKGLGSTFRFTLPIAAHDMAKPVRVYPKPTEYHGILVRAFRRLNAFITLLPI